MDGVERRGDGYDPSIEMGSFHCSWFPIGLAHEIKPGTLTGVDFLGTRVVVYRDGAGKPVVQSAWCPHLGADLSGGEMVDGRIRCAYHHWRFDETGSCVHIPTGDKIAPGARIFTYPTAEAWGLVWAFNGKTPLFGLPQIPDVEESELAFEAKFRGFRTVPPWVSVSNGVDFQHLRTLHGLGAEAPETVDVREHAIEYQMETSRYLQHGLITGTNVFAQHLRRAGMDSFMLFAGAPVDQRRTRSFFVIGVERGGESTTERQVVAAKLRAVRDFVEKLLAEDEPIFNTMRFKKGTLVAADRHLSLYFKYVSRFPRAKPPAA